MSKPELLPHDYEGGFLNALLHDARANTIVIGAAAMVPLLAMVGGAVDASRFYMAETRMQAACDAGALAARRAMESKQFTAEHRQLGENFYDQNFSDGMFGLEKATRTFSGDSDGVVTGVATGELPTSLMGVFGYDDFTIKVDCEADINISNTDVMFVVDVTGSMNCAPNNPNGGNCGNVEATDAKIKALRNAVMTFYDTVENSTSDRAQVRYGMVPYASNVNVGYAVADQNSNWMARDWEFQTRYAKYEQGPDTFETIETVITDINYEDDAFLTATDWQTSPFYLNSDFEWTWTGNVAACDALRPPDVDPFVFDTLQTHQGLLSERNQGNLRFREYRDDYERVRKGVGFAEYYSGSCAHGYDYFEERADVTFEIVDERTPGEIEFDEWVYAEVNTASPPDLSNPAGSPAGWSSVNLADVYTGSRQVSVPIGNNGAMTTLTWDGCIEEAQTVASQTWDPIPNGALDMNVNLVPETEAERWKPVIPNIAWERRDGFNITNTYNSWTGWGNSVTREVAESERVNLWGDVIDQARPDYTCPRAAFRLTDIDRTSLQSYVNSLQARSNTYHDIGMLWGARFVSENGIFAAANQTSANGDAIARHIVFMTDGLLEPNREVYGTYGVERWSRRVSGDGESATTRTAHRERFQAACTLARQENISVWVVAFGTELGQNLIDCATPGRAFVATTSLELENRFREIAQRIAALRLTK